MSNDMNSIHVLKLPISPSSTDSTTTSAAAAPYGRPKEVSKLIEQSDAHVPPHLAFPPEVEKGKVEYKLRLVGVAADKLTRLQSQLFWRLSEGEGEALYRLGVMDDGRAVGLAPEELEASLDSLRTMAGALGPMINVEVVERYQGLCGVCATARVSLKSQREHEVRVAFVGAHDAGKSTLVSVLVNTGVLDDGKGKARFLVAQHKHETARGRTTSVSLHAIRPSSETPSREGSRTNSPSVGPSSLPGMMSPATLSVFVDSTFSIASTTETAPSSAETRCVRIVDVGGATSSFKSTLRGLCAHSCRFAVIAIDAKRVMERAASGRDQGGEDAALSLEKSLASEASWEVTKGFTRLARALGSKLLMVITKVDRASNEDLLEMKRVVQSELLTPEECLAEESALLDSWAEDSSVVPFFQVSSVSGSGIVRLRHFLSCLQQTSLGRAEQLSTLERPSRSLGSIYRVWDRLDRSSDEDEDDADWGRIATPKSASPGATPNVTHAVVSCLIRRGRFVKGDAVLVGPSSKAGEFVRASIVEIRSHHVPVSHAEENQSVSLKLAFPSGDEVQVAEFARRGAVVFEDQEDSLPRMVAGSRNVFRAKSDEFEQLRVGESVVVVSETGASCAAKIHAVDEGVATVALERGSFEYLEKDSRVAVRRDARGQIMPLSLVLVATIL